ncbi:4Fe-4S binding protein [Massilia sp. YIM B02763]|uniref:4Fe-4S binding protein n=1 Tax=Massilia sp. YIM B02763 TaxID=3050130 RepID=UPI0025B6719D|nr:4Fe-4S binding protein [Massilia sp. YIM B02763]MDN4051946.1 4Fe-4S binding protein [Massilia sp. YIM B02763]
MNIRLIEGQDADPQQEARNLLARAAALAALDTLSPPDALDTVAYRSAGNTLVVGSRADALPLADRLAAALPVTVLLLDEGEDMPAPSLRIYPVFQARALVLSGWLGAFEATWQVAGRAPEHARFDLVADLGAAPRIGAHQRPHGYYAPGPGLATDAEELDALADELLEMVGDFEKPKYFQYKERLCAHSRNERTGCNACIAICSAEAISGAGDLVKVNPYLCAGCGACTTVCPTGALAYAYPSAEHTGRRVQAMLNAYFDAGGSDPVLLFHGVPGAAMLVGLERDGQALPARVLPVGLHHAASTGIDVWLAALAWGAAGVAVLTTDEEAPQYVGALERQMAVVQDAMAGLGYAGPHVQLLRAGSVQELGLAMGHAPRGAVPARRAGFHLARDKRDTLEYALDHLYRHAPVQPDEVALAPGSPFGALAVDQTACSLCMSCVGACPAHALQDGQGLPQLRFIEKNCVQCGLCADTCPEDAIALVPRLSFLPARKQPVVLADTQPFHCIRCSKPFGTVRMIEAMLARLSGHPAFAGNLDRMRMCGDCRVVDMMAPQGEMTIGQASELKRR